MAVNYSKRSLQVNVRLSPDNLRVMREAAERIWPGVPLTNSTRLLTLAQHKAVEILDDNASHDGRDGKKRGPERSRGRSSAVRRLQS